LDASGQPFDDPTAREALFSSVKRRVDRQLVRIDELDLPINDEAFAAAAAEQVLAQLEEMSLHDPNRDAGE
jgi:uncharacterized protein (UPF0261 family)